MRGHPIASEQKPEGAAVMCLRALPAPSCARVNRATGPDARGLRAPNPLEGAPRAPDPAKEPMGVNRLLFTKRPSSLFVNNKKVALIPVEHLTGCSDKTSKST